MQEHRGLKRSMPPSKERIRSFREKIHAYFATHSRELPWRKTQDPYKILVSEIMLQQTQVERVIPKYLEFTKLFPDFHALRRASQKDVLAAWQGLGYNRRALALKRLAEIVVTRYEGKLPKDREQLAQLPGIGKTTAGEILAFAFNIPSPFIETNIRRVFIHEFFDGVEGVRDGEILPIVEATLDRKNPREWYWALMDYGSMLKKRVENPNRRSAHYSRQMPFGGSDRRIRGIIVRVLLRKERATEGELLSESGTDLPRLRVILSRMAQDGLVKEREGLYSID